MVQLQLSTGSGALHSLFSRAHEPTKAAIALGLTLGGSVIRLSLPFLERSLSRSFFDSALVLHVNRWDALALLGVSGLLVGAGTKLASGCTSGAFRSPINTRIFISI